MPIRLCLAAGCPRPASYRGYCAEHARVRERRTNRAGKAIYNSTRWKHTRRRVLFLQPLCAVEGCGEIATDVDHIVPLPDGAAYELSNLQGLCAAHHGQKTRREQAGKGRVAASDRESK